MTLVGLNSFSDNSCEAQTIDVYTRVSSYSSWIVQQVCALSSDPPDECDAIGNGSDIGSAVSDCFDRLFSAFYDLIGWN